MRVTFQLNGREVELDADPFAPLDGVLRDALGLVNVRSGCGSGDCGVCTVSMNGRAVVSCLTPLLDVDGAEVWTSEGLEHHPSPRASGLMKARAQVERAACGHCLPALCMTVLTEGTEIQSLVDVLCRCSAGHDLLDELARQKRGVDG